MEASPTSSWQEFVTAYEAAHRDPRNRAVHHATHVAVLAALPLLWRGHPLAFAAISLLSLPVNWLAHAAFEGNAPAFLRAGDAWQKAQVAVGGLAWTAVTLWRRIQGG